MTLAAYKTDFTSYIVNYVTNDPDLLVTGVAGAVYRFEAVISYWSATAGTDLEYVMDLSYTPGDTPYLYAVATTQAGTFNYQPLSSSGGSFTETANNPVASTNYGIQMSGLLDLSRCANPVSVQAMFALVNNTKINVNAGSHILLTAL